MDATRRARIESFIQQELSQILTRDVRDPRVSLVTLTRVELSADASSAKIFVSVLSAPTAETPEEFEALDREFEDTLRGLESASGFLRKQLGKSLSMRQTPELRFVLDKGLHNSLRVFQLLKGLQPAAPSSPATPVERT
jgi:ribosome-binding factor A